jgi:hypothetical protein
MKHSLRKRYDHFNQRVFDNTLPSKFRIAWINMPTEELGIIDYIITSHGRKNAQIPSHILESGDWDYTITSLRVGRHENKLTDDDRDALLLHEMIHVKMLQDRTQKFRFHKSDLVGLHDDLFRKLDQRYSERSGIGIPVCAANWL